MATKQYSAFGEICKASFTTYLDRMKVSREISITIEPSEWSIVGKKASSSQQLAQSYALARQRSITLCKSRQGNIDAAQVGSSPASSVFTRLRLLLVPIDVARLDGYTLQKLWGCAKMDQWIDCFKRPIVLSSWNLLIAWKMGKMYN